MANKIKTDVVVLGSDQADTQPLSGLPTWIKRWFWSSVLTH